MMRVKICGITNLADALLAAEFGADELGFNFYRGSSRCVDAEICKNITDQLPENLAKIGVFVNEKLDNVCRIADVASLNAIQLHGDETDEYISELRCRTGWRVIKAFRVGADFDPNKVLNCDTDSILLDAASNEQYGGTGRTFDWDLASRIKPSIADLYLAGGLAPANLAAAVRAVRPDAVDTASGVELSPGKKDPEKLRSFITAAKNV